MRSSTPRLPVFYGYPRAQGAVAAALAPQFAQAAANSRQAEGAAAAAPVLFCRSLLQLPPSSCWHYDSWRQRHLCWARGGPATLRS